MPEYWWKSSARALCGIGQFSLSDFKKPCYHCDILTNAPFDYPIPKSGFSRMCCTDSLLAWNPR